MAIASCREKDKWLKQRETFHTQLNKLYNDEELERFFGNEAGRRVCLVLDNASWHHIEPIYLPPSIPSKGSGNTSKVTAWRNT